MARLTITPQQIRALLVEAKLLKEFITEEWHYTVPQEMKDLVFTSLSYDSRQTDPSTLFFCKGAAFKESYLASAVATNGLRCYVSEQPYENCSAYGIIVTDIRAAMACIAQAFYNNPQDKLFKIGITGTKGKTSCAYFLREILAKTTNQKVAFFSSEENSVDGKTYQEAVLTTPETLDLYAMMAEAVANGLTHLVMEVSSQAYKTKRVLGITYEIGIFLNISPDHIGPVEHPNFDDYLFCKRELIHNSKQMIINRQSDYFALLAETCDAHQVPLITYGRNDADYQVLSTTGDPKSFQIKAINDPLLLTGNYQLALLGEFNHDNATAAIVAACLAGATKEEAQIVLPQVTIPGRMVVLEKPNGGLIIVDYAHNYLSFKSLSELAKTLRPEGRLIFVTGSAGGKAESRRPDMGRALSEYADKVYLTADDPNFEDPQEIANEIAHSITNSGVTIVEQMNRTLAVEAAVIEATSQDIVILAGKGTEQFLKVAGQKEAYEGDLQITQRLIG
jgi:UDP-N-acetylmuramoyl-L-alanyl-D-glutamate-L-lysine ligase